MIFGEKDGRKTALVGITPTTVRQRPIEQLGTLVKSLVIKAEDEGADALYICVTLGDDE